jgi:adenylyltransferase/sulfurtransferase
MSRVDWDLLNQRRSCSLLARRAIAARGTPTTPTTASIVGGMQAHEVVKILHGLESLLGRGYVFEGLTHSSYAVRYSVKAECPWHDAAAPIEAAEGLGSASTLGAIGEWAAGRLGGLDALDLGREIVEALECPACARAETVLRPADAVPVERVACPGCGGERAPRFLHSLAPGSEHLALTAAELGLPPWDVVWARHGERQLGVELAQDRTAVLGDAT